MGFWSKLGKGLGAAGAIAGAPFTGGGSMAWLAPTLTAGASISGALGSRSQSTSKSTLDPAFGSMQQVLLNNIMGRLNAPSALPEGFEEGGIGAINRTFDVGSQNLENTLSARGLSRSPIAGSAIGRSEGKRLGEIGQFRAGLPLVERDLRMQDMQQAMSLLGQGRGYSTEYNQGGGWGGAIGDAAGMLGFLQGQGLFGQGDDSGTTLPGFAPGPGVGPAPSNSAGPGSMMQAQLNRSFIDPNALIGGIQGPGGFNRKFPGRIGSVDPRFRF